jgi:N-acetylglucosaminyldiphosphoundecaprenol N-acetyl-beta-D-mannosaminyltransferase
MFKKNFLLGVGITIVSKQEVLEYIITGLQKSTEKYYVVTPNPELLVIANKDSLYKNVLNSAKLALPDGIGVLLAGQVLHKRLKERITGVDLMEMLCKGVAEKPITIGFLGAGPGVADKTSECLQNKFPGLRVNYISQEWTEDGFLTRNKSVDLLFVAFGSPKQEFWISKNLSKLPVKVAIGVGGAFDFESGKVKRAPKWMRETGLEWLFRLINQPWRLKRQLSLITFIMLVFKEFLTGLSSD